MLALLEAGVGVSLISRGGKLRGRLAPPTGKNIPLRHRQYARAQDPAFCLAVARAIVLGKLRNQCTLARRICRGHPEVDEEGVWAIKEAISKVKTAGGMASLRGIEGRAARGYFGVWRQAFPDAWRPEKRVRRPPSDPLNALQSLGYTLLTENLISACEIVGLDPYDGFFHAEKYGRPALALDLMEEFRSVIVDSLALILVNKGMLSLDDFRFSGPRRVYLSSSGLRTFFEQYAKRINTRVKHPTLGKRLSYQQCFEVQARALRKTIQGQGSYLPFRTR
jgi:CRISPR-associated protein Cas1